MDNLRRCDPVRDPHPPPGYSLRVLTADAPQPRANFHFAGTFGRDVREDTGSGFDPREVTAPEIVKTPRRTSGALYRFTASEFRSHLDCQEKRHSKHLRT